jgi:hypothetical protein
VRRYWKKATLADFKGFVLSHQMSIDFDRLTRIERENTKGAVYAEASSASSSQATMATANTGGYKAQAVKPLRRTYDMSTIQCLTCGHFGQMAKNCQQRFANQVQATQNPPNGGVAYVAPAIIPPPPQLALGNGSAAPGGKGNKNTGGKGGKGQKGKR